MNEYLGVAVLFLFSALIAGGFILLHALLSPNNPTPAKAEPFECGVTPFNLPKGRVAIKFYLTAILFIIFDVDLVFLFPWAVIYRRLGIAGFVEMMIFLALLIVGLAYAWRKGALEWE